ncbi:MAG TPA: metallophosphoesterase [Geobacterales bacterium]|nr:metallophosphoesterase [Geobacterales bacterium]
MIKVLAITDIHFNLNNLRKILDRAKDCDLILVAGDITNFGKDPEAKEVIKLLKNTNKPYFFVPGNCDYAKEFSDDVNEKNIHGKFTTYENLAIIGLGGSTPTPFNTPFELSEETIKKMLYEVHSKIAEKFEKLILMSHVPPYNTLLDTTKTGIHVGSRSVRQFIEEHNVDLVISGHVHEARSIDRLGKTVLVNPGPALQGNYAIITIGKEIDVKLEHI